MPEKQRWVRRLSDGRIFGWTPQQATKEGMVECDAAGNVLDTPPEAAGAGIGVPDPFRQAEFDRLTTDLAVAQQTIEAQNVQIIDLQAELAMLKATVNAADEMVVKEQAEFDLDAYLKALPPDSAEAKLALDDMAKERYGIDLDRRASLPKMIEQVRAAESARQAAA